jgi:hypothetical protein
MQLAGELSKISLPSLVQLVRNGGLTGEISLTQGTNSATIFVEQGRVIHVESDVGSGRDAFLELFLWLTGTFSFVENRPGDDIPRSFRTDEPIERLLREGLAYLEEKKYLDQLRISGQTILKPTTAAKNSRDNALLDRIDGKRTLAQALADANLSRRAYVRAVFQLLSEGLVVVAEPVTQGDHVELPGWVVARLKQDNQDISQAIVDMVIWVDRIKCWMYQADADMDRIIADLGGGSDDLLAEQVAQQAAIEQVETVVAGPVPASAKYETLATAPLPAVQKVQPEPAPPPVAPRVQPATPSPATAGVEASKPGVATPPLPSSASQALETAPPLPAADKPAAGFRVARATPLPPPPGSGRASDLFSDPSKAIAQAQQSSEQLAKSETVDEEPKPAEAPEPETAKPAETPQPASETQTPEKTDPPQAIPRAPWTRAAMARKPFLGNSSGSKPSVPPRSIEF